MGLLFLWEALCGLRISTVYGMVVVVVVVWVIVLMGPLTASSSCPQP